MHTCSNFSANQIPEADRFRHKGKSFSRTLIRRRVGSSSPATLSIGLLILFSAALLYPISAWAEPFESTPTKDTFIFENVASSHRSNIVLQTRSPERRTAFLQFDLSDIPEGSRIISAKLKLYMGSHDEFRRDSATRVYAVLDPWSESINWFNRPAIASSFEDSVAITEKNRYFEWDITDLTRDWVNGVEVNNGVSIVSEGGGELYFHSRENPSNKPVLTVEYSIDDPSGNENSPPEVNLTANRTNGRAPLTVTFNSNAQDPGGSIAEHRWDFDDNGVVDQVTTARQVSTVYDVPGQYTATVTVIDNEGASTQDSIIINVSSSSVPSPTPDPGPSPTPTPTSPPSSSRNPWKYSTGKTFDIMCVSTGETDSTLIALATSGVCTSFLTSWEQNVSGLIKTTPGSGVDWVVAYFNFGAMDTRTGISFHDARFFNNAIRPQHPEWILRETTSSGCNGAELGLKNLNNQAGMDVGSMGSGNALDPDKYVDRWIKEVLDNYEEKNWDGIWADIYALWSGSRYVRLNTDIGSTPCNPRTGRRYTEAEWHTDLLNATKRIRTFFDARNLILLAQTAGVWVSHYDDPKVREMSDNIHVIHIENFAMDYDQSAHNFETWLQQTEVIQDILKNRLATIVIRMPGGNKGISTDKRFYQDASWLLVKEHNMMKRTFTKLGLRAIDPWWPTTNLGSAQGDMFVVSGTEVRRRNYRNGMVLANPDDTGTYTVNLGGSYTDVQTGDSVSSVTLTPKKGVILTR